MQRSNFFPLNDSILDSNVRGESPLGFCVFENVAVGTMTAGKRDVTVKAPFGKGLGEVLGAVVINAWGGIDAGFTPDMNTTISVNAAIGSSAEGDVILSVYHPDATRTTNSTTVSVMVFGRIFPVNA